jgi:hypothetical protein
LQIAFKISLMDLIRFNVYHASRRGLNWLIVSGAVLLLARTIPHDLPLHVMVFIVFLLAAFMIAFMFVVTVLVAALSYAPSKNRAAIGEHVLTIEPDTLTEETLVSTARWSWAAVPKISHTRAYIFIYVQQNMAHVIPKSAFASRDEASRFYGLAVKTWKTARGAG